MCPTCQDWRDAIVESGLLEDAIEAGVIIPLDVARGPTNGHANGHSNGHVYASGMAYAVGNVAVKLQPPPPARRRRPAKPGPPLRLPCGHTIDQAVAHSRPCIFVSCRAALYMEVNPETGSVRINSEQEVWEMDETCALDVADKGRDGITLEEIGRLLGLTRERIRQVEVRGLLRLRLRGLDDSQD